MPDAQFEVVVPSDDVVDLVDEPDDQSHGNGYGSVVNGGEEVDVPSGGHKVDDGSETHDIIHGGIKDDYLAEDLVFY